MRQKSNPASGFWYAGLIGVLLLLTLASAAVPARMPAFPGVSIKNFGKINDHFFRGSQPSQEEFAQLKKLGIKTVIDLRKDSVRAAPDWARGAGLQYFSIPLKANTAATEQQTSYFFSLVNDPANWPVYVHCKGGRHRTGAMTAVYRIAHDGWSADQAYREMKEYDFNDSIFGGPGAQKNYVYAFYEHYRAASTASQK